MSELNFQNTEIKCNGKSREEEARQHIVLFDPYFCFLSSVYTSGTGFFLLLTTWIRIRILRADPDTSRPKSGSRSPRIIKLTVQVHVHELLQCELWSGRLTKLVQPFPQCALVHLHHLADNFGTTVSWKITVLNNAACSHAPSTLSGQFWELQYSKLENNCI